MNNKSDYWLDIDGNLIPVASRGHNEYAQELLIKECGNFLEYSRYMEDSGCDYPYQILHKRGWIRIKYREYSDSKMKIIITGDCCDMTKIMRNTISPAMNSIQMEIAKKLCEEIGVDILYALNN